MIYASIDLGSDSVKITVIERIDKQYNVLASTNTRVVGIKKGIIRDETMVVKSLEVALLEIEKQLGFKIDKAIVAIPPYDATIGVFNSETDVSGIVSGSDIATCFKRAIKENISNDREVISVFPIDFLVNEEERVYDPKGMPAYKLETRILISTVPKELVYSYLEVFEKCHVEVIDLCFSCLGDYYQAFKKDYQHELGVLVDIGSAKTEIAIFNKGLLIKTDVLLEGSKKIDQDIKYIYKLDSKTARDIKENFAVANLEYALDDVLEVTNIEEEMRVISQREVSEVLEARLIDILKNVKKHINDLTNKEISYIIITGGISNIPGFNSVVESIFGDITNTVGVNLLGARSNIYSSCIGMIKYLNDKFDLRGINYSMFDTSLLKKDKRKNVLNDYLCEKIESYVNNN